MHSICTEQKTKDAETINQSPLSCNKSQKINDTKPILLIVIISTSRSQKVDDTKFHNKDAIKKTRTNHTIKLFTKTKDVKKILLNSQKTFSLEQSLEIENLIFQLTNLLGVWNEDNKDIEVMTMQTREKIELGHKNLLKILTTRINLANATNHN